MQEPRLLMFCRMLFMCNLLLKLCMIITLTQLCMSASMVTVNDFIKLQESWRKSAESIRLCFDCCVTVLAWFLFLCSTSAAIQCVCASVTAACCPWWQPNLVPKRWGEMASYTPGFCNWLVTASQLQIKRNLSADNLLLFCLFLWWGGEWEAHMNCHMSLGTTCYVHVLSETSPCMSPLEIGNNFIGVNKGGQLAVCIHCQKHHHAL